MKFKLTSEVKVKVECECHKSEHLNDICNSTTWKIEINSSTSITFNCSICGLKRTYKHLQS